MKNEKNKIGKHSLLMSGLLFLISISCEKGDDNSTVTDIDGNVYHTVTIGMQTWMLEDLKTTHYRNGDPIPKREVEKGAQPSRLQS